MRLSVKSQAVSKITKMTRSRTGWWIRGKDDLTIHSQFWRRIFTGDEFRPMFCVIGRAKTCDVQCALNQVGSVEPHPVEEQSQRTTSDSFQLVFIDWVIGIKRECSRVHSPN
jgi:hypothetical protein